MFILRSLAAFLSLLFQAGSVFSFPDGILSPAEKLRIERESKVENRIKVYEAASKRIHRTIQAAISKDEFETLPANLRLWTTLLEESLKDIEANLKSKKKPRPLINYEIQLRKAIAATQKSKIRAPVDQHEVFDSCLERAKAVRKKIMALLFRQ